LYLKVDAAALLPPDDSAFGFDNIAETLGASPVLVEQYLSAAGKIAALAGCFAFYIFYTFVELKSVMKKSKKPDA